MLLALSVAVPYALLVTAVEEEDEPPVPVEEVVAVPIQDDEFDLRFEDAANDTEVAGPDEDPDPDPDGEPDADNGPDPDDDPEGT